MDDMSRLALQLRVIRVSFLDALASHPSGAERHHAVATAWLTRLRADAMTTAAMAAIEAVQSEIDAA